MFLLHGWLDCGETFQFIVDAFKKDRPVIAPDWRGFGRSEWPQEGYWFPDYLGDFDAVMDQISPDVAGAHRRATAWAATSPISYAGLRPERVRCVVNLEGFGLPRTSPQEAPKRMRKWLDQIKSPTADEGPTTPSSSWPAIIQFRYPRFSRRRRRSSPAAWGTLDAGGRVRLAGDPRHHWVNPILYKREDAEATGARSARRC